MGNLSSPKQKQRRIGLEREQRDGWGGTGGGEEKGETVAGM